MRDRDMRVSRLACACHRSHSLLHSESDAGFGIGKQRRAQKCNREDEAEHLASLVIMELRSIVGYRRVFHQLGRPMHRAQLLNGLALLYPSSLACLGGPGASLCRISRMISLLAACQPLQHGNSLDDFSSDLATRLSMFIPADRRHLSVCSINH